MKNSDLIVDDMVFDAFKNGDEKAFTSIYHCFKRQIYVTTYKIVRSEWDAEDITVKTFTHLWDKRLIIRDMQHLKNFLFIVSRNLSIDVLRYRARVSETSAGSLDAIDNNKLVSSNHDQVFAELIEEIWQVVSRMPKMRREVFFLRYKEDKSADEVSALLHISINTVYKHTSLALEQMRSVFQNGYFGAAEVQIICFFSAEIIAHSHSF